MNRLAQLVPGRGALASPLAAGRESGRHAAVLWTSPRPLNQAAFQILGFLVQRRLVALRPVLRGVRAPAQRQDTERLLPTSRGSSGTSADMRPADRVDDDASLHSAPDIRQDLVVAGC